MGVHYVFYGICICAHARVSSYMLKKCALYFPNASRVHNTYTLLCQNNGEKRKRTVTDAVFMSQIHVITYDVLHTHCISHMIQAISLHKKTHII